MESRFLDCGEWIARTGLDSVPPVCMVDILIPPRSPMRINHPAAAYVAAAFVIGAAALAPSPASARSVYDGNWSVLIVTNKGSCDRAYRYGLSIRNGSVIY